MIHRPENLKRAGYKAMRAAVWSRRIKTKAMRPLERACAQAAVTILSQDAQELMRLAHVPRPVVRAFESPSQWLMHMVTSSRMAVCAPIEVAA